MSCIINSRPHCASILPLFLFWKDLCARKNTLPSRSGEISCRESCDTSCRLSVSNLTRSNGPSVGFFNGEEFTFYDQLTSRQLLLEMPFFSTTASLSAADGASASSGSFTELDQNPAIPILSRSAIRSLKIARVKENRPRVRWCARNTIIFTLLHAEYANVTHKMHFLCFCTIPARNQDTTRMIFPLSIHCFCQSIVPVEIRRV